MVRVGGGGGVKKNQNWPKWKKEKCPKWPKMNQNGQFGAGAKLTKIEQNCQNWPEWEKSSKVTQNEPEPKSKEAGIGEGGAAVGGGAR